MEHRVFLLLGLVVMIGLGSILVLDFSDSDVSFDVEVSDIPPEPTSADYEQAGIDASYEPVSPW